MVDVARLAEEEEVAGSEVAAVDRCAVGGGELRVGHARDLDAGLRVRPLHEAGAVEAGLRRRAAPLVGGAGVLLRLLERGERARAGAASTAGGGGRDVGGGRGRRGRDGGLLDGGGCGRRRPAPSEQPVGLAEAQLVAPAVLRGRPLDVGDPLAELLRVGDRLAAGDALLLDLLGGVEEPLDLQLGLVREALVRALVPDPDAHLEEPDGVGVAEVEVLHARLDERRHHRQLPREPALLGQVAHPLREVGLRGVVARVAAGGGRVGRAGDGVGHADSAGRGLGGDRGGRGRVAADADELDVGLAGVARDLHDLVLVVALQRGELAALDVAGDEPDVAVGAEVVLVAPVVGDDVAGPRVLGADDLEVVLARLGVADPGLDRGPAGAVHLAARLLERPGHEARAPGVAGGDLRRPRGTCRPRRRCWCPARARRAGSARP